MMSTSITRYCDQLLYIWSQSSAIHVEVCKLSPLITEPTIQNLYEQLLQQRYRAERYTPLLIVHTN